MLTPTGPVLGNVLMVINYIVVCMFVGVWKVDSVHVFTVRAFVMWLWSSAMELCSLLPLEFQGTRRPIALVSRIAVRR